MKKIIYIIILKICILLTFSSCEDFLNLDEPVGQINSYTVFENEATANASVTTLYAMLRDEVLLAGNSQGLGVIFGLYADELDYYGQPGQDLEAVYNHQILSSNYVVKTIWKNAYKLIYGCNSALEGIDSSVKLSEELRNQLKGEVLFIRSIVHYYLTKIYGNIPYIVNTDYQENSVVSRAETEWVIQKIKEDLLIAKELLMDHYPGNERVRANRFVVSAFLAKIYLNEKEWQLAINECDQVINQSGYYQLENDIAKEFLRESTSAIFQLKPAREGFPTHEANYIFEYGPPINVALSVSLVESFEETDLRRANWIKEVQGETQSWYMAYKYKNSEFSNHSLEYSIILRLAELYLIKAESYAHLGNISLSIQNLNLIRNRAGLENLTFSNQNDLLDAILTERRHELFTEQGNRWFDLTRFQKQNEILSLIKPNWRITDVLFPIPEEEILLNPYLLPQNPGY
jgi:hypothetical protein